MLTQDQVEYLRIFLGYKSFARQEYLDHKFGPSQNKTLETELINLGILKRDSKGSLRSLPREKIDLLIVKQTRTAQDLQEELDKTLSYIETLKAEIKRLQETDKSFCFYSRDKFDHLNYQVAKVEKLRQYIKTVRG